jgi:hypothetical protein
MDSLSLWERAGGEGVLSDANTLTLTLSQREKEQNRK